MAIKIVGVDDKMVRQVTCRNCGTVLEYLPVDVEKITVMDYTGCADTEFFITCPQCKGRALSRRY